MKILDNINFDDIDFSKYKKEIDEINNCVDELKKNELLMKKIKEGETMKIIDLLNKMANDSEYKPKTVIHKGIVYRYNEPVYEFYDGKIGLFGAYQIERFLNDEIEIIEEEKEIVEIEPITSVDNSPEELFRLAKKINELVRELNKLKKEGK